MFRLLSAAALLLAVSTPALADTFAVDPGHTSAEFAAKHLGISTVRGTIPLTKGSLVTAGTTALPTSLEATFDVTGIDSHNERRDNELKTAFFDVAKYPTMTFKSTKIQGTDPANFKIDGDLTMHGVTKPIVLEAKLEGRTTSRNGKARLGYVATTTIDRHLWNVQHDNPVGDAVVGNDITITIEAEAAQQ